MGIGVEFTNMIMNIDAIAEFAAAPVAVVMRVCHLPGWPLLGKCVCLQSIMPHVYSLNCP
jgi:hypothetical protein